MQRTTVTLLVAALVTLLGPMAIALAQSARDLGQWATYRNPKFGFAIEYPAGVLVPDPRPAPDAGALFASADGKIRLLASAGSNETSESIESYREFVLKEIYIGAAIDYAPVRKSWFVLSGTKDGETFYERITFACEGRVIYGWQLRYPTSERVQFDRVVERIHRSYKPGRGEDGNCG